MIRAARVHAGLSLRELARRVGVCAATISILERSVSPNVGEVTLTKIAETLSLEPDALVCASGRIPSDVQAILLDGGPALWSFLRDARRRRLSGADLARMLDGPPDYAEAK